MIVNVNDKIKKLKVIKSFILKKGGGECRFTVYITSVPMLLKFADTKFGTKRLSLPQVMDLKNMYFFFGPDCSVKCPFLQC